MDENNQYDRGYTSPVEMWMKAVAALATIAALMFVAWSVVEAYPPEQGNDPAEFVVVKQSANTLPKVIPNRPCPQEDSAWCTWDARHRGNGVGRSFYADRHNRVHFMSHRGAHRILRWYALGFRVTQPIGDNHPCFIKETATTQEFRCLNGFRAGVAS